MDERTLTILEFTKIREMLARHTASYLGRELAEELMPDTDFDRVASALAETGEAAGVIQTYSSVPLGGIKDIRHAVNRASIGASLEPTELLDIAGTLSAARRLKRFLGELKGDYPVLTALGRDITVHLPVEEAIFGSISDQGEVLDTASPELERIRRAVRVVQQRVRDKLEGILRSSDYQKYLQEALVTIRDDRYCIPVKQEFRNQFPGIVHDQSASGATLFIEPMAVVELNNELKKLAAAEKAEIARILAGLSAQVGQAAEAITPTLFVLARLDFIFAKGKLSLALGATAPKLNQRGYINIKAGRHPLLRGNVVPTDIYLGGQFTTLVITGPNTGGKTVTLKTVGLFALMAQAGLHLPAGEASEMAVFEQVFADIGDEQSIEQSLSTFSSHMTNIVRILGQVNDRSLVLLDELGAGTDPTEGAALAMAILEYLYACGARTIATTHYSELKTFAYSRPGVENASVEFDIQTLQPTYKLLIGLPGRSNAFEIARRLGLSPELVDRARALVAEEQVKVEELLARLAEEQRRFAQEREEAAKLKKRSEILLQTWERERAALLAREKEILAKAREEALSIVQKARREAEAVIDDLKAVSRHADERSRQEAIRIARERLKTAKAALTETPEEEAAETGGEVLSLAPGETVYLPQFKQKGFVVTTPNLDGDVVVQVGILKVTVPVSACRKLTEKTKPEDKSGALAIAAAKIQTISPTLDLRGMTVDEATEAVDKYLDDASLAGLTQVQIIHGKGTGALRAGIRAYLAANRRVKAFRLGGVGEGGEGVTVVELQ